MVLTCSDSLVEHRRAKVKDPDFQLDLELRELNCNTFQSEA